MACRMMCQIMNTTKPQQHFMALLAHRATSVTVIPQQIYAWAINLSRKIHNISSVIFHLPASVPLRLSGLCVILSDGVFSFVG